MDLSSDIEIGAVSIRRDYDGTIVISVDENGTVSRASLDHDQIQMLSLYLSSDTPISNAELVRKIVGDGSFDPATDMTMRWRRKDDISTCHLFQGFKHEQKSLCGQVAYPIAGQAVPKPKVWQKCRACLKISNGVARNTKGFPHG